MRLRTCISTLLLLNLSVPLSRAAGPILVAAAADLAPLSEELSQSFAKSTGGAARFTFAASGLLARQIAQGAPYDVYLSANEAFVKQLEESGGLLKDSVRQYARGRIALWAKRDDRIRSLQDLAAAGVRHVAIANPAHAPYGAAARDALKHQGLWEKLSAKIVYGENVQQTLQYAETGNADAAITAWSLVLHRGGKLLPEEWHSPIRQVGGVVSGSRKEKAARQFMMFLTGKEGRAILRRFGFD